MSVSVAGFESHPTSAALLSPLLSFLLLGSRSCVGNRSRLRPIAARSQRQSTQSNPSQEYQVSVTMTPLSWFRYVKSMGIIELLLDHHDHLVQGTQKPFFLNGLLSLMLPYRQRMSNTLTGAH